MYEIKENSDDHFILEQPPAADSLHFVNRRVVPLLLFMSAIFVFQQLFDKIPMGWVYLLCLGFTGIAVYILLQKHTGDITITSSCIKLAQHSLFGEKEKTITADEIKKIHLHQPVQPSGKSIFTLHTAGDKKITLVKTNDTMLIQNFTTALQKLLPGKLV